MSSQNNESPKTDSTLIIIGKIACATLIMLAVISPFGYLIYLIIKTAIEDQNKKNKHKQINENYRRDKLNKKNEKQIQTPNQAYANLNSVQAPNQAYANLNSVQAPNQAYTNLNSVQAPNQAYTNLNSVQAPNQAYTNLN